MNASPFTSTDRITTRHHTGGGRAPTVLEHTDVFVDGQRVTTITWQGALLRRLEREGRTRAEYIAHIASRYTGAQA